VSICGDGLVVGDEECDDDNTAIDDGCSSACAVEPGWTCSAGNPSICAPTDCGDGVVVGVEACYDGNLNAGDGCTPTCAVEAGFTCNGSPSARAATCGDGFKRGTEACDDANANDNDGCSSSCLVEGGFTCTGADLSTCSPICGDGQVKAGSCTLVTSLTASAGFDLDGFHVLTTSSAVDAAGLTSCPADDFDGDLRPINASCDVGADERP
jgi:cysteine-rich repeat protein